jgi:hypothetical protein
VSRDIAWLGFPVWSGVISLSRMCIAVVCHNDSDDFLNVLACSGIANGRFQSIYRL